MQGENEVSVPSHDTFFVNGHECRVEGTGYRYYTAYLDGEEFDSGHENRYHLRKTLFEHARWMERTEPDYQSVAETVYEYVEEQDEEWVTHDAIEEDVVPELVADDMWLLYSVLNSLVEEDLMEESSIKHSDFIPNIYRVVDE
jgi:hypothetical protein